MFIPGKLFQMKYSLFNIITYILMACLAIWKYIHLQNSILYFLHKTGK